MPKQQDDDMKLERAVKPLRPFVFKNAAATFNAEALPEKRQAAWLLSGLTPLSQAVRDGNISEVVRQLKAGFDPCQPSSGGITSTPLEDAVTWDQPEIAQLLIKAGAVVTQTAASYALRYRNRGPEDKRLDIILMQAPATQMSGVSGLEPYLLRAAHLGEVALITGLVNAGANVNMETQYSDPMDQIRVERQTPVACAVNSGKVDAVRTLLQAGADGADAMTQAFCNWKLGDPGFTHTDMGCMLINTVPHDKVLIAMQRREAIRL